MVDVCNRSFTRLTTPAGADVAKKFPWWATSYQKVTDNNSILDKFTFRAPSGNRQAFANDKAWPIYITEIRFWATVEDDQAASAFFWYRNLMERTCFRFRTDLQRDVVSLFMPGVTYNTEDDRHLFGYTDNMVWTLPAPYYLPYGSQFAIEVEPVLADMVSNYVQFGLRGCDPNNHAPVAVVTEPRTLPDITATPRPGRMALAFDDNRDRPVRNMWVQDFTASALGLASGTSAGRADPWRHLYCTFYPPDGPRWTDDEKTPLIAFADQVGNMDDRYDDPVVIHKPPRPYILRPGDAMEIEMQVRYVPDAAYIADHRIWAHVRGWQMGGGV